MSLDDHREAAALATDAGKLLMELRAQDLPPAESKAQGDTRSQQFLAAALASRHPADAVLSEEAVDDLARLGTDRV